MKDSNLSNSDSTHEVHLVTHCYTTLMDLSHISFSKSKKKKGLLLSINLSSNMRNKSTKSVI